MFYKGSLVYAGQLGGEKIRVASEFKPYKMLYVEPTFSDMIWGEKLLKAALLLGSVVLLLRLKT